MKNRRVILVLLALVAIGGGGIFYIVSWYRSGTLPAGPSDFFDPAEMDRTIRRLESFRLPVEETIALCAAVTNHTATSKSVRFTNPTEAIAELAALQRDLASIEARFTSHVQELEEKSPGQWQEAFQAFLDAAHAAYANGIDLAQLLARTNWSEHSYNLLEHNIVEGKTLSGRARKFPPWRANADLRDGIYPAFDEAYGRRDEYDLSILARQVIAPNSPLIRWFYARRYESLLPIPSPPCPDPLLEAADDLEDFAADIQHSDPEGMLTGWVFPERRAGYLRSLGEITLPLHEARQFEEWVAALDLQAAGMTELIALTQAGGKNPDPGIKILVGFLQRTKSAVDSAIENLEDQPTLASTRGMLDTIRSGISSDPELLSCFAATLHPFTNDLASLVSTAEAAINADLVDEGESFLDALRKVSEGVSRIEESSGLEVREGIVRDVADQWSAENSAASVNARAVAGAIESAAAEAILRDDVLPDLADFLRSLHSASTIQDRETLAESWESSLRARMADFPNLANRIDLHLGDLQRLATLKEIHRLISSQQWEPLRESVQEILTSGSDPEWQTHAGDLRSILKILDLPGRFPEISLRDLRSFAENNSELLPAPPRAGAIHTELFRERIEPLIVYADAVSRIGADWTPEDCFEWIEKAWSAREKSRKIYGAWGGLDREFGERVAFSSPACLPADASTLYRLVDLLDELKAWPDIRPEARDALGLQREAFSRLADLLRSDMATEGIAERTEDVRNQLTRIASIPPEAERMLVRFEQKARFERRLASTPNSFLQLGAAIEGEARAAGSDAAYLEGYIEGMRTLHPVVEMDRAAIRGGADISSLLKVAVAYADAVTAESFPGRLTGYAERQAATLRKYATSTNYTAHAIPGEETRDKGMKIAYRRISESFEAFGYGRRFQGHGTGFSMWIRGAGSAGIFLEADWKDEIEERHVELTDLRAVQGTFPWGWGDSIEIGISVYHTFDGNRNVVPDSGGDRSRWNPFNYGQYRAETNEYTLARFDSLETLVRTCLDSMPVEGPLVLTLDRYFMPGITTGPPVLQLLLEGVPEGRDFDWPEVLTPLTIEDAGKIREDLESTINNLINDELQFGK